MLCFAGFGTSFLAIKKAINKELLPILDNPLGQYAAKEAIAAGVDLQIFVICRNKHFIEKDFDNNQQQELFCVSQARLSKLT